ncbi:lipoyl synthase [Fluviispira multicolorata]|uniref:Lipoyl synthase n=1 Tax=Fluviispira multicolorata TaxID=2654512 RepID=A0A833JDI0_9BACT|nr:lipoyl synthase [Fluviispira multicolorata]KAB8031895.1 lipoyl synthase [Fluviispira multicolorata]
MPEKNNLNQIDSPKIIQSNLENREEIYAKLASLAIEPEINPRTGRPLKPHWLKVGLAGGEVLFNIKKDLREKKLYTVCEEAKCPNISGCWNTGTATFMIMGDVCTRGCRFCHIKTGNPGGLLDAEEPLKVAESIRMMNLSYAVITMVDRDDIPDGGAVHIAKTIEAIHTENPKTRVEILAGDFRGQIESIQQVVHAGRGLDVFAHNVETVRRLSPRVRDARAKYDQSLKVLQNALKIGPKSMFTKSAIMLGLGEEFAEVEETLKDLRNVGVEIITIGQYLQPTTKHLTVKRFVHPEEFEYWKTRAKELGFKAVAAGPLVRSSYKASELFPT